MFKAGEPIDQESLEALMDAAWPAVEHAEAGPWVLRASEGVTQRANSVWPRGAVTHAGEVVEALRSAADWYRRRKLPLILQTFDDARSEVLHDVLDTQRFTRQSETLIMVRGTEPWAPVQQSPVRQSPVQLSPAQPGVELSAEPTEDWLRLWWAVDGRGGERELAVAREILTGCPSLYALARDDDGNPAAVGRLALVGGRGGIYCMATAAGRRRQGFGSLVLAALLEEGTRLGLDGFWLLVTSANAGARRLYETAGFLRQGSYLYRQAPLRRAPGGC
ncbi:GNAT family N-acetyltransferase [Paenarthrobacter ureafaciens]|jgi:ribosomal protein S18 acetylase RimI-like enzyme|uniref:GNAT family N-acetyltransferase n=1 Tax=Paenarthrobacter ureafaciens TaxID=37931 RepID=UPI00140C425D|nr:GNAT family N-acetyltransferase [Paenarthrobacter ureafaciens]MCX8453747.1 GNAT family N-acetyltransferase [Paenarthrobacter ureafaciens]MCY0971744.1 GNAT family N-acetyltransferase [Paenarthrobacter ureafaciens]